MKNPLWKPVPQPRGRNIATAKPPTKIDLLPPERRKIITAAPAKATIEVRAPVDNNSISAPTNMMAHAIPLYLFNPEVFQKPELHIKLRAIMAAIAA